jgi:hypothetical protein
VIKVINYEEGRVYKWSGEKLKGRVLLMSELVQEWEMESKTDNMIDRVSDPLWDPESPCLICWGFLTLVNVPYLLSQTYSLDLLTSDSHSAATLSLSIIPLHSSNNISHPYVNLHLPFSFVIRFHSIYIHHHYHLTDLYF